MAERLIQEETLVEMADAVRSKACGSQDDILAFISERTAFNPSSLPEGLTSIGKYAFYGCSNLALTTLPESLTNIGSLAFNLCSNLALTTLPESLTSIGANAFNLCLKLKTITFNGVPNDVASNAFSNCYNLTTINVPWSEGEVANAPWGATKATINYNYTRSGGVE